MSIVYIFLQWEQIFFRNLHLIIDGKHENNQMHESFNSWKSIFDCKNIKM